MKLELTMATKFKDADAERRLMRLKKDYKKRQHISNEHPELSYMVPTVQPMVAAITKKNEEMKAIENATKNLEAQKFPQNN